MKPAEHEWITNDVQVNGVFQFNWLWPKPAPGLVGNRLAGLLLSAVVLTGPTSLSAAPAAARAVVQDPSIGKLALPESRNGPTLFMSRAELARATDRCQADPQAREKRDKFLGEADKLTTQTYAPIDESWWEQNKDKPWEETYPQVYEMTGLQPGLHARAANSLATAWLLSNEPRYADKANDILMALAVYSFEPVHFDVGMNYSVWGFQMLQAYDAMLPRLSPTERGHIDACFTRLAEAVLKNDIYWMDNNIGGGLNNHLAWHKMMLGLLGLFYDRPDLVEFCLYGRRGLVSLLEDGLLDDGLWCESSLHYHFTGITPMLLFADCQHRMGNKPTLLELTLANGRTLRQPLDAMINVLAADGLIPPIGDAYGGRSKLWSAIDYEYGWRCTGDPTYAWVLRQSPDRRLFSLFSPPLPDNPPAPPIRSILLPEHGYVFLRSHRDREYWGTDAWCAFLTYDRAGVHANADKLSLMIFGQKKMLLSDVEGRTTTQSHAFSSSIQRELNRGGLSQNTVMIDGADQRYPGEMLQLVEYRDLPDEKRVTAADFKGLLYEGVRQMRTVAMTSDYILDVFQVDAGSTSRQIDWIAHIMDSSAAAPPQLNPLVAGTQPFELPKTGPWIWLREPRAATPEGNIELNWSQQKARLRLTMLNTGHERVIFCGYPDSDAKDAPTIPMLMVRHRGPQAVFAAVWRIGDRPEQLEITTAAPREGKLAYRVTADGKQREHHVPALRPPS